MYVRSSQSSCEAAGGIVRSARAALTAGERGPGGETGCGHASGGAGESRDADAAAAQTHTVSAGQRQRGGETPRPAEVMHTRAPRP